MPSQTELNDSNNESTNKNRFSIGQLVKTTPQNSNCWDEQTSKLPVGTIGKVVDLTRDDIILFDEDEEIIDPDNVIVSFPELIDFAMYPMNTDMIEPLDGGEV